MARILFHEKSLDKITCESRKCQLIRTYFRNPIATYSDMIIIETKGSLYIFDKTN